VETAPEKNEILRYFFYTAKPNGFTYNNWPWLPGPVNGEANCIVVRWLGLLLHKIVARQSI